MKKIKILFVCTENVFRSFSAQILTQKYLKDNNIENFEIDSCGIVANSFEKPYEQTLYKLEEIGIDRDKLVNHQNKKVNLFILKNSNYIICMTKTHQDFIKKKFNINSNLFNEITYNKLTDLQDDVETNLIGTKHSLNSFLDQTIEYINLSIPILIENIQKNNI